jgi:methylmalonyl-CoA mutase
LLLKLKQKKLFEQFPPVTGKEWIDKITSDLKGADFYKRLVFKTGEGFDVMPFYRKESLEDLYHMDYFLPLLVRGDTIDRSRNKGIPSTGNQWLVRQNIKVADYSAANKKALEILMKGIDSLGFIIEDPETINEKNLRLLIEGIDLEGTEINFLSGGKAREIISLLIKISGENGIKKSLLRGTVEADPLSKLMMNGTLCIPVEAGFDYLASLTEENAALPYYRNIQVNGSNFGNAGSGAVQELGFTISMAVEYLSQLTERGIKAEDVASKMRFSFGIGSGYFIEIARLRAARILWSLVNDAFKPASPNAFRMEMHCVTSEWNTTIYDPYVNMLRSQTEAMSAILGGTDSLTVNPFNSAFSEPTEFSERIARNQQLILREEAYFDKVTDPASGSYYIENLTKLIAESAWILFLEIEDSGGFYSSLKSGLIQDKIEKSTSGRKADISKRKEILLGTNQFPNPDDIVTQTSKVKPVSDFGGSFGDLFVKPVKLSRGSEEFEKIRMAVDNASRKPVVFLLAIGNHVMRRARSQFSSGFFGCAGYKIIDGDGYDSVSQGVENALKTNAEIVVICSSDEEYLIYAPEILDRLKGKAIVAVAGNPPDIEELKARGLNNFISLKSDISETLKYYNSCLGIK